jgi:hypothetical protein
MAPVETPMITMVMSRVLRLPIRSPRLPKITAPIGRTMNETARTENAPMIAAVLSSSGKNSDPLKIALKYAKTYKSNDSREVPTNEAHRVRRAVRGAGEKVVGAMPLVVVVTLVQHRDATQNS